MGAFFGRHLGPTLGAIALACSALACGNSAADTTPPPKPVATACGAGETASSDGSCIEAGVPPDGCAAGFTHDDDGGCVATLPAQPCDPGRMALPGETTCRPVSPCGQGKWGDAPVDATTQYVDVAYAGGASDGTAAKPWIHIQDAVNAAPSGGVIAIAAGKYPEAVLVTGKPVRLWGACADVVTIAGVATYPAAIGITKGANGTEAHALGVMSSTYGLIVQNATDVTMDRLWIHDGSKPGIVVDKAGGAASASVTGCLVEANVGGGLVVVGATLDVEKSIVRASPSDAGGASGVGIGASDDSTGSRATLTVKASIVEANHTAGILGFGSDVTVDGTLVRDTEAQVATGKWGSGILAQVDPNTGVESTLALSASVLERNTDVGLVVTQATATVKTTVVRDTQIRPSDETGGTGVSVEANKNTGMPGKLDLGTSLVEGNHGGGIAIIGSQATVEATRIAHTAPIGDGRAGIGFACQVFETKLIPSSCTLRTSVVEDSEDSGILATGATLVVDTSVVRDTHPQMSDGKFGDGLSAIVYYQTPCDVTVTGSRIEKSARAGIAAFGAAIHVGTTVFECNAIQLDGERQTGTYNGVPFDANYELEDLSGNTCGCAGKSTPCAVLTSMLEPPLAI